MRIVLRMQGLLLKLSQLDARAADAVRVIGFFDRLLEQRACLDIVMRSAAALAERPVGFSSPRLGVSLRADPGADPTLSRAVPADATTRELDDGTVVWLARTDDPTPLDGMLLERLAIIIAIRLDHTSVPQPQLGDPALVELVLSRQAGIAERSRALHLLRLDPAAKLRVLATTDPTAIPGPAAKLGSAWAILCTAPKLGPVPRGTRLGAGPRLPALEAIRSWQAARGALRFTTASEPVVHAEQLGCLGLLADRLDHSDLAHLPDLTALDRLAAEPNGDDTLAVLDALCANGSVRQAATALHRHHSTIQARLCHARKLLNYPVTTPAGRFRLQLALTLRRLRDNPDDRHTPPGLSN